MKEEDKLEIADKSGILLEVEFGKFNSYLDDSYLIFKIKSSRSKIQSLLNAINNELKNMWLIYRQEIAIYFLPIIFNFVSFHIEIIWYKIKGELKW